MYRLPGHRIPLADYFGRLLDRDATAELHQHWMRPWESRETIFADAPPDNRHLIDPAWAANRGTIYLTYSLQELQGAGSVVASIIAALLRQQMAAASRERLLVAIDELPALGLKNIVNYLATMGGFGVMLLLYVQSIAQLRELYGREGTRSVLSNCAHQLYEGASYAWQEKAELLPSQMMALPKEQVLVSMSSKPRMAHLNYH